MCQVPARNWRDAVRPARIAYGVAALAVVGVGLAFDDLTGVAGNQLVDLAFVVLGAGLLLFAVLLPTIRSVQFSLPAGVGINAAVVGRSEKLEAAFAQQRGVMELCAHALCDDPADATRLLAAAWSGTTLRWRGPPGEGLDVYVWCELARLVAAHSVLSAPPQEGNRLAALDVEERIAVIYHQYAGLTIAQIAAMRGVSEQAVAEALRTGTGKARLAVGSGS